MTILDIKHVDRSGTVLWQRQNVLNLLHTAGERYLLEAAFVGGQVSTVIPENYYLGLDRRTTLAAGDTLTDLIAEPTTNGYARQSVSSTGEFTVSLDGGHYKAVSPILSFTADGGSWGPIRNLFLATSEDSTGILISTADLGKDLTVVDDQSVLLQVSVGLTNC